MRMKFQFRKLKSLVVLCAALLLGSVASVAAKPSYKDIINTYADIAHAGYEDSLKTAVVLQETIRALLETPTEENLKAARQAWIDARVPYMQTEAYRFGNAIVDDWEGRVNAWPLDEGLIDYVAEEYGTESDENELYIANIIASKTLTLSGRDIDASSIDKTLLINTLHEAGGVEGNVATGYHAIEFLLWGQDLNGTEAGAGKRPATDYDLENCTGGNCDRRAAYLRVSAEILIDDLTWMTSQWAPKGPARQALLAADRREGLVVIFTGLGSLTYGELAGERMKLGLLLNDPEEEHDCFSDNTHNSHYYDLVGISNVYRGRYKRIDGTEVKGASISALLRAVKPAADTALLAEMDAALAQFKTLKNRAETIEAYDQMIGGGNREGNKVVSDSIDALLTLTKAFERASSALDLRQIEFVGSNSLDNPDRMREPY